MLRKYGLLALIGLLGAALPAFEVHAQIPSGPQIDGNPPGNGGTKIGPNDMQVNFLLTNKKVLKELDLTDEQKAEAAAAVKNTTDATKTELKKTLSLPTLKCDRHAMAEKIMKRNQHELFKKTSKILRPEQFDRLKQLYIQCEWPLTFSDPYVIGTLKITGEQLETTKTVIDDYKHKMYQPGNYYDNGKIDEILLELLTPDQRAKFEKITGEKFDFDWDSQGKTAMLVNTPYFSMSGASGLEDGAPSSDDKAQNAYGRYIKVEMRLVWLLKSYSIQKELKLSDEQKTKAAEEAKKSSTALNEKLDALPMNLAMHEVKAETNDLIRKHEDILWKKLGEILLPNQLQRLNGINIQCQGAMALFAPGVIEALNLTEKQQKDLTVLYDEFKVKWKNPEGFKSNGAPDGNTCEMENELTKERDENLLGVLTQDQRGQFEKLKGAKIDVKVPNPIQGLGISSFTYKKQKK